MVLAAPSSTGVVDKDCEAIRPLLDFGTKMIAPCFVLQIGYNIFTSARAKLLDSFGGLFSVSPGLDVSVCEHIKHTPSSVPILSCLL